MGDTNKTPPLSNAAEVSKTFDTKDLYNTRTQAWFSSLAKIMYRDLNNSTKTDAFYKYTREQTVLLYLMQKAMMVQLMHISKAFMSSQ